MAESERPSMLHPQSTAADTRCSAARGLSDPGLQPARNRQLLAVALPGLRAAVRRRAQLHLATAAALAPFAGCGHDGGGSGHLGCLALGPRLLLGRVYGQQAPRLLAVCFWRRALPAISHAGVGGALVRCHEASAGDCVRCGADAGVDAVIVLA